jgi:hypothetical protein
VFISQLIQENNMTRKQLISQLRKRAGFTYIGCSSGYGSSGTLYDLDKDGLTYNGTLSGDEVVECPVLTDSDIEEAIDFELVEDPEEEDYMIKAGCESGVQYWRLNDDFLGGDNPDFDDYYTSYDEALNQIDSFAEFTSWEEMSVDELASWFEIVKQYEAKQPNDGILSCYDE